MTDARTIIANTVVDVPESFGSDVIRVELGGGIADAIIAALSAQGLGVAEEAITGIWWVVREGESGITLDQRLRQIRGPFPSKEAAEAILARIIADLTKEPKP